MHSTTKPNSIPPVPSLLATKLPLLYNHCYVKCPPKTYVDGLVPIAAAFGGDILMSVLISSIN
jgi:hypothetical protein